ncbi:MAG: ABC transporter substrate-binding protein [Deltaproteobacteria bacterium]|nr:ABC transporter substrate-binding protein [Deltaproteobacteria bacterium]
MYVFTVLVFLCAFGLYPHCVSAANSEGPVTVASKIDTEGALLGQMIVLMLRDSGFKVKDKTEFGPTDLIRKAIINGEIDIYPEYTGNGGFFFSNTDPAAWKDARKGYETVRKLDFEANRIVWLKPAPANNTWAIAVRKDLSGGKDIKTLEDLARYAQGGGTVKLAGSEEFVSRPDALPAFEKAYGFHFSKKQLLVLSGGNTAQTEKAAADETDGVNFAMAYGTDGSLAALGLLVLEDTKGVQPVYEPAPIVRETVLKKYPRIQNILEPVFSSLDLETLQTLNASIAVEGQMASAVAEKYLRSKGFLH